MAHFSERGFVSTFIEVLVVVVAIMGFLILVEKDPVARQPAGQATSTPSLISFISGRDDDSTTQSSKPVEITYSGRGFTPYTTTLSQAGPRSIIVYNRSGKKLQIASYPHPSHADFPALNQPQIVLPGESYIFVFSDVRRVYQFHNEFNPEHEAVIIAE